jgi:hypothetical protein
LSSAQSDRRILLPIAGVLLAGLAQAGDINNDGAVDLPDLLLMQQHLTDLLVLDTDAIARGDLYLLATPDNQLTISDLLQLQ